MSLDYFAIYSKSNFQCVANNQYHKLQITVDDNR
jgi:hypothetical protein